MVVTKGIPASRRFLRILARQPQPTPTQLQPRQMSLRCLSSSSSSSSQPPPTYCDVVQGPSLLRTPVARPSPTLLFLPGLRSLPFWTNQDHSKIAYGDPIVSKVVEHLESNVDRIRNEYIKVAPTMKSDYEATDHNSSLHEGNWDWHSYLNKGSVQGHFAFHFPETAKILQSLRDEHLLFEGTPFGFCFFSTLHGQASIQAHTAPMNLRLRIHLPLIVPKGNNSSSESDDDEVVCGIRVGPIVRPWVTDKALVLDDAYDHEVWNRTDEKRVLLLVDIWHPDITLGEKQEVVKLFQDAKQQGLWKR